ncbi:hypothetical protein CNBB1880 [Cryptococcus deneoformans B-3501A]|uniref:Protein BCP1 n=1 Tax=Cryptococcus deneoformans (strain JEC21 / ATCC MYA-565) TaxID=214684 RepID=Q5KLW2_CRYD1|nr:conserved hypothetical protein [Cryptococcus neoformans var. neoformans JEC21]XP_777387.1 hypothetical protein CNBB1880 [Cryptococcus neoformans var. neoformans B-3501A]AAW41907.2 conserved hypothetical protein [Cryptococcus neoformans var. neoformans JEC21]EAL22740.1 hypothetical protein CNBB1880 [Cryptococcus neoformans var. neoformans B-3501A]
MPSNPSLEAVSAANATKRKNAPRDDEDSASESGSDVSMINVDFDFYNLNPDVDLIAVKRLLRQTLSYDEERIDVHSLAELLLAEGVRLQAGSSIKTDGEESDPWGLVAVIDIVRHKDHPALKPFLDYLGSVMANSNSPLQSVFSPSSPNTRPALVFSLRMLNLPLPLIPHLYRMLLEELETKEEGRFTHFLVWGRGYRLEGTEEGMGLDMNVVEKSSKKKKALGNETVALSAGSFPYHPEEEFMDKVASQVHTYNFKTAAPRDAESFGVEQFGRLVLLEKAKLVSAIQSMQAACQ